MEEAEARFEEALEVLLKAWTADAPWSHHGKYWQFEKVVVEPPTAQKPHPPLWMGAGRPASIKKVAAYGYNLLLDQFAPVAQIGERIALFKAEVEARGRIFDPMSVAVTRSINVVTTAAEREKALETRLAARRRMDRPDEIAARLQALRDVGAEYVLLNSAGGLASLRRFAHEVQPAFAGLR
jgi:alkanesulfonate monooxygenase SsuD/methylene tetrahydromethanopterin reductase-like flavin-dependent oxidoreductase (luciferase family)